MCEYNFYMNLCDDGCGCGASVIMQVTYGSVIKLQHERTKYRLHSHEVPYGSGSGQQSVTGFPGVEDANSYWVSVFQSASEWFRARNCTGSALCFGSSRKWLSL